MNIAKLKIELTADPLTRGYAGMTDQQAADSLNTVDRTVNLSSISGDDTFASTDGTEFAALTDLKKQLWLAFCGRETIDPFGTANVAFVTFVFGGGSTTVANLAALRTFQSSRANELGLGTVQPAHVDQANNYHG